MRNNHAYALLVQAQTGAGLRGSRIEGIPPTVASLVGGMAPPVIPPPASHLGAPCSAGARGAGISQLEVEIE